METEIEEFQAMYALLCKQGFLDITKLMDTDLEKAERWARFLKSEMKSKNELF